jgi:pyruvate carboxylase
MGSRRSRRRIDVNENEKFTEIALENGTYETRVTRKYSKRTLYQKRDPRIIKAVIPGAIAEILTAVGKPVRQGDFLMILEAMKMLNRIMAPIDGTVKAIRVATGEKVSKGQVLIELE